MMTSELPMPPSADQADLIKSEANVLYKLGKYQEAADMYARAIDLDPQPTFYSNRAAALMMLRQWQDAANDCLRAITVDPTLVKVYVRLAKSYLYLNKVDEAVRQLHVGKAVCLENRLKNELVVIQKELATATMIATMISQVNAFMHAQTYDKASQTLENMLLLIEPGLKTQTSARGSRFSSSEISHFPRKWQLWRGECLVALKNFEEAQSSASQVLLRDSTSSEFLVLRARAIFLLDTSAQQAINHLTQSLSFDPDNTKARVLLRKIRRLEAIKVEGNEFFKQLQYEGALEKYTEWLATEEADSDPLASGGVGRVKILSNRAIVYSKMNEHSKSASDVSAAIQLLCRVSFPEKPDDYHPVASDVSGAREQSLFLKLYLRRADAYIKKEQYEEAVRDYSIAKDLKPQDQEIHRAFTNANRSLKASKKKDYYKILGLDKGSDESEIKKAYRKLALQFHPDKCANMAEDERADAERKFKDIAEANSVLSDPEKKRMVDMGMDVDGGSASGMGGGGGGFGQSADMGDILNMFFQQGGMGSGGMGGGMYEENDNFGSSGHGFGGFPGSRQAPRGRRRGHPQHHQHGYGF